MEFVVEFAQQLLKAFLQLFMQPFYYLAILFVILHFRKQIRLERKLFHTKLHSLLDETWRTVAWGIVGGIAASIVLAFVGSVIEASTIVLIWVVSIILILFRVRYLCITYSVGIAGVLYAIVQFFPNLKQVDQLRWLIDSVVNLHMPTLLGIVAFLHVAESIFIRVQGARLSSPIISESKRGKIIGGYQMQGYWPVPLFLLVPWHAGSNISLPWTPLLGGDLWNAGWIIAAFPVVIGISEWSTSRLPEEQARRSSSRIALFAVAVLIVAVFVYFWPFVTIGASIIIILLHEVLIGLSRWEEARQTSLFVHDEQGLKILAILPRSPADEMGLLTGEIIRKVNGLAITSKEQMHQALQTSPAFCKLEVINLQGQSKFVKRAIFSGDHHQLGVILAPDQDAIYPAVKKQTSIIAYLLSKWN